MEHKHSSEFCFVVNSILLHLFFLKAEPNWLNSNQGLDYVGERNGTFSECKNINFKGSLIKNGKFSLAAFVPRFGRQLNYHTIGFRLQT